VSTEFKLPEVGEGIEAGTVVSVLVSEGDRIEVDQAVLEFETDKAVVEVPSSVAGVVRQIHVKANEEVKVGQTVLTVDEAAAEAAGEEAPEPGAPAGEGRDEAERPGEMAQEDEPQATATADRAAEDAAEGAAEGAAPQRDEAAESGRITAAEGGRPAPAAPSVRRLAREQGVDLKEVSGSGALGRISADDVLRFAAGERPRPAAEEAPPAAAPEGAPAAAAPEGAPAAAAPAQVPLPDFSVWGDTERVAMSGIRKATVRAMRNAWATVPMVTHFDSADATEFEALRQRYKRAAEALGAKLTPTAMLIKVVAAALRKFPDFNASLDVEAQEIVYKRYVNVGVAVDTDRGLLVPVVKNADQKNMLQLAVELGELAEKARDRKLGPEDMQGGNLTVSNLGGIGGQGFTPIVDPPDVAILGVARSRMEPVWDAEQETFVARLTMPLALTYDHRLIDGASAARFLRWICRAIEEPFLMALEG
jgi:pyruvate dehydrogenase E2 component (dihydrolipoamide acetyltransferase)